MMHESISGVHIKELQQQQPEPTNYAESLRPTTTGVAIRTQGDVNYSTAGFRPNEGIEPYTTSLRPTAVGQIIRETGAIPDPHRMQSPDMVDASEEKKSVKHLVKKFRARQDEVPPMPYGAMAKSRSLGAMGGSHHHYQQQKRTLRPHQEQQQSQQPLLQPIQLQQQQQRASSVDNPASLPLTVTNRTPMQDSLALGSVSGARVVGALTDPSSILGGNRDQPWQPLLALCRRSSPAPPPPPPLLLGSSSVRSSRSSLVSPFTESGQRRQNLKEKFASMLAELETPLPPMPDLPIGVVAERSGGGGGAGVESAHIVSVSFEHDPRSHLRFRPQNRAHQIFFSQLFSFVPLAVDGPVEGCRARRGLDQQWADSEGFKMQGLAPKRGVVYFSVYVSKLKLSHL